jgi:hypothetical protein
MGEFADSGIAGPDGREGVGRRRFIAGAAVAGGLAFAAPAIVTMKPAGASTLTSPPPEPPGPPPEVIGETAAMPGDPGATAPTVAASSTVAPAVASGQLPFTGANAKELAAWGLAATATGAAMVAWSAPRAEIEPPEATPPPVG